MQYCATQIKKIIDGELVAKKVPNLVNLWCSPLVYGDKSSIAKKILEKYSCDVRMVEIIAPHAYLPQDDDNSYVWIKNVKIDSKAIDSNVCISNEDFEKNIDKILQDFPSPHYKGMFKYADNEGLVDCKEENAYKLGHFWYMFYERHWSLRGMENAMTDFYDYPESVHKLYSALADFYCQIILRAKKEKNIDGIFISDDIGAQNSQMFSENVFMKFFAPYYKRVFDFCHSLGIQFWLHSCGNIRPFIPRLIDIGLDVLHPIQKNTMNEEEIVSEYGNKICIWVGFDVQNILPFGTEQDVRKEVQRIKKLYNGKRWLISLGNGITADCPLNNLEALLDEIYKE